MPEGRPSPGSRPVSTYRLQLQPGFGFAEAAAIAGYLADLGVSHVYLSPILQAAPGSTHGYDVVDHSRVSADLGGEAAFRAMVAEFRRHGLGVVVDVVPNHMAIPVPESLNRPFWSVLRDGPGSPFASWFDVDWAAQDGRLLLPILAGSAEDCRDDIRLDEHGGEAGEAVLRYFEHVLPVRPGTASLPLAELLAAQHYRLADWHTGNAELNWRRFFDITSLIGIRVEHPEVFAATHEVLLRLVAEGLIDGLRIDHPDGLADPRGYLDRLFSATGGAWLVTEKILTGHEELPADWPCAGTTGYDALRVVDGLFLGPAGAAPLTREYQRFTGGPGEFAPVAVAAKREIASRTLAAEVSRLARLLARAGEPALAGVSPDDQRSVLVELLSAFSVYRAYVVPGEPAPPASAAIVTQAVAAARRQLPVSLQSVADVLGDLVLGRGQGPPRGALIRLFQQVCGPVMAKGVEDTAFYRWPRLTSLNEVGGEPDVFGVTAEEFHAFARRIARDWPATMTTLSTHDTKRGEDVRARLAVLAERAPQWQAEVARWHDRASQLGGGLPEPDTEYLMWQTLAGAWPVSADRLEAYLRKAMREAKTRTSWASPDEAYEAQVLELARQVLADGELAGRIGGFVARLAADARVNSLGAKLIQLTMPGVPDLYQGCELASFTLVDPDNRQPADFARRRELLAAQDSAANSAAQTAVASPPRGRPGPGRRARHRSLPAPRRGAQRRCGSDPGDRAGRRGPAGRGQAAGHFGGAAAAPGPSGLVRGQLHPGAGGQGRPPGMRWRSSAAGRR